MNPANDPCVTLCADVLGAQIYARAGMSPLAPEGCGVLVERLYGRRFVIEQPRAQRWASLATWGGQRRIAVRAGLSEPQMNWALGWGLAGLQLEAAGLAIDDALCSRTAGWLAAPTPAFAEAYDALGLDVNALAHEFVLTGCGAAIRVAEMPTGPSCVVALKNRKRVRRCGHLLQGFSDEAVHALAANRRPRNVHRLVVDDGIALFAKAS